MCFQFILLLAWPVRMSRLTGLSRARHFTVPSQMLLPWPGTESREDSRVHQLQLLHESRVVQGKLTSLNKSRQLQEAARDSILLKSQLVCVADAKCHS